MEAAFLRFDSYDFEADRRFQSGLVSLQGSSVTAADGTKVLEMKLFFYNRFVEPIDSSGYKQWRFAGSRVMDCSVGQLDQQAPSAPDADGSKNDTLDTGAAQLSFEEVMRLVQAGEEVPGVTKLDVQPSDQTPTPPQMERILKPWEIAVSK